MSIRTDRVARMIQREVADLLQQDFSEATQSLLTVTGARVTKDLGIAYLNVSILGDSKPQREAAFARLEGQTDQIRADRSDDPEPDASDDQTPARGDY